MPAARRFLTVPGVLFCAVLLTISFGTHAQSRPAPPLVTDLPPETAETGVLGEPQLIEADVGTDVTLSRIELFHRFDGETDFRRTDMTTGDVPGVYAASVPTEGVVAERLEFYIVAEDESGGTFVRGNAAEPLTRTLTRPPEAIAQTRAAEDDDEETLFGGERRKYLYYALGALVVGAIAVAASDGGSSDEGCAPEGCRLTLTLPPPTP